MELFEKLSIIRGSSNGPPASLREALRAGRTTMHYNYVIKSKKDGKLYIGFTNDLQERMRHHNNGLVKSTKNRGPFKLIYYEACLNKNDAIRREKSLKTGFGRAYLKRRISDL